MELSIFIVADQIINLFLKCKGQIFFKERVNKIKSLSNESVKNKLEDKQKLSHHKVNHVIEVTFQMFEVVLNLVMTKVTFDL